MMWSLAMSVRSSVMQESMMLINHAVCDNKECRKYQITADFESAVPRLNQLVATVPGTKSERH